MLDPFRLIPKLLDWCLVFFNMDLCMWLLKTQVAEEPLTAIFFPLAIWSLWLHKNRVVFRNSLVSHDLFKEVNHCATRSHMNKSMQLVRVRWNKPMESCHKLSYSVENEIMQR